MYEGAALIGQLVAARKRSPKFTLDGEPLDLADFIEVNELESEQVAALLNLQPGETMNFGGGAAASFVLRREVGA